jgi:hypothetical protein
MDQDTIQKVEMMGVMNYDLRKILNIVEPNDPEDFKRKLQDPNSELGKAYQRGADKRDFKIDMALWEKAKEGDAKALDKWEQRNAYKNMK